VAQTPTPGPSPKSGGGVSRPGHRFLSPAPLNWEGDPVRLVALQPFWGEGLQCHSAISTWKHIGLLQSRQRVGAKYLQTAFSKTKRGSANALPFQAMRG